MEKLVFGWKRVRIETIQRQADYLEILLSPTTASGIFYERCCQEKILPLTWQPSIFS
jgi:hypothetical protein